MQEPVTLSRRELLKGLGVFGTLTLAMGAGGCESCWHRIRNRPTRRNIAHLAASDPVIDAYKAAVSAMKALPSSDPRNWTRQANIHFDHCPHGNWWFLPWHRAYLLQFERICRKLSGYDAFALPYWNWTTSPSIPGAFWGAGNPLLDATRTATPASTASPSFVGASVIENILSQTNFFLFASSAATGQRDSTGSGMLEGTPHNYVHGFVGGDMGAFHSPLDPIFWTHHNMIDCLWVDWNLNRGNPNTNDPAWATHEFTEFFDENGAPVTVNAVTTVLYPLLTYQFEPCAPNEHPPTLSPTALETLLREGAPAKIEFVRRFPIAGRVATEVGKPAGGDLTLDAGALAAIREMGAGQAVVLTVGDVEVPDRTRYFMRVFVGRPDASADTPLEDPHYAGSFAFFVDSTAMPDMAGHPKPGFLVNVTATVRRLAQGGGLSTEAAAIRLVPVPFEGRQAIGQPFAFGRLELALARF